MAPILIFIGLEITAQAFLASPPRHGAAVALTFVPVAADGRAHRARRSILAALGKSPAELTGEAGAAYRALLTLGNGFILTALLWGSALVFIIDAARGGDRAGVRAGQPGHGLRPDPLAAAERRGLLAVGRRAPRWPRCCPWRAPTAPWPP